MALNESDVHGPTINTPEMRKLTGKGETRGTLIIVKERSWKWNRVEVVFFFSPYFVYSFPFPEICVLLGGALIACSVKIMEQLYIRKKKVLFFLPKCSEHLFESINILHAKKKKNQNVSSDVKVFFFPYFFPPCLVYANQPVPHFYKEVSVFLSQRKEQI